MSFQTTDLCDAHEGAVNVVEPMFQSFGGKAAFSGQISTIKCFEDNWLVREALGKPGAGRVLVVDGWRVAALRAAGRTDRRARGEEPPGRRRGIRLHSRFGSH